MRNAKAINTTIYITSIAVSVAVNVVVAAARRAWPFSSPEIT